MSFDTKMIVHAYQSISIYPYSKDKVLETSVKYVFSMSFDYVFQERDLQSVILVVNDSYVFIIDLESQCKNWDPF